MSSSVRSQIIALLLAVLSPKVRFNELLSVFMKHKEHNPSQAAYFNRSLYSTENLKLLIYDVKKLYDIKDIDLKTSKTNVIDFGFGKVIAKEINTGRERLLALNVDSLDAIYKNQQSIDLVEYSGLVLPGEAPAFSAGVKGLGEMKLYLKEKNAYNGESKMVACKAAIEAYHIELLENAFSVAWLFLVGAQQTEKELVIQEKQDASQKLNAGVFQAYSEAEPAVKDGLKLRVEFPFLSDKDCPDKLKVLVADKFTALENYEASRQEIKANVAAGDTDLYAIASQAVENWELNQLIYDELTYYAENGEILGNHPIFEKDVLQRNVDGYKTSELTKRRGNLRSYISRDTKKVKSIKDAAARQNAEKKISAWQIELDMIDNRLEDE